MNNFEFYSPTKIIFGEHQIDQLANNIPAEAKILLLYGGGSIKKTGTYDEVKSTLSGRTVIDFGGIEANPEFTTLMKAVELIKQEKIDFLLAVGGGSVIDGTKFIAGAVYSDDPWELLQTGGRNITRALPIGAVLTLAGTASEMNSGGVISYHEKQAKLPFSNPLLFPKFSILDPSKTLTLPEVQVVNGVIDSFIHVMEQYLTYPVNAKVQDRFSEGLLLTILEEGKQVKVDSQNLDVRKNLMLAATFALNGLIAMGVPQDWSTHQIGHQLTALYHIDHAQTLAIVLPGVWKVLKEQKFAKLLQYADRVLQIKETDESKKVDQAIAQTELFFQELGVGTKLKDYNLDEKSIEEVVGLLEKFELLPLGEKRNIDANTVRQILQTQLS